ncbi:MAG: biotin transporter BioY [Clostridia bacterium]|nr:biotin transporter BioY [Clostridia bacterium]MDE7329112.1 biotin transporter BioY [Clostridia bacterium]
MNGFDNDAKENSQELKSEEGFGFQYDENAKTSESGVDLDPREKAVAALTKRRSYIVGVATSGMFIALMIISAYINIPIGPISITMQFLVANICSLMLGKKWGTISLVLYLALGLLGLPIFSAGGGFSYVLKPSFGFIIGFAIGGFFGAWFREKTGKTTFKVYMLASLINLIIVDIFGTIYGAAIMYGYSHSEMGVWAFFMAFLIPFIPVDLVKCIVGSIICNKLVPKVKRLF